VGVSGVSRRCHFFEENTDVCSMALFLTLFMSNWCRMENKRREKVAMEAPPQELTQEQKALERELADDVPWFRYSC
jgi:hypothetical protein